MRTSSQQNPKPASKKSILLVGPPGGGKTSLALLFPRLYVIDCDMNLDGPDLFVRSIRPELSYSYDHVRIDDNDQEVPLERCADRLFELLVASGKNPDFETIFIDGLSHINEMLLAKTMYKQGRQDEMQRQDWIPFRRYLLKIILHLRTVAKTTIMSCHEEIVMRDGRSGPIVEKFRPAISSKLTDYFGGFFTDIWRCTPALPIAGKPQPFKIQVIADSRSDLKNSIGFPTSEMSAKWEDINKYLKLNQESEEYVRRTTTSS